MFFFRLLKYLFISSLISSAVSISAFAAWKMGYISLPEPLQKIMTMTEDMAKTSQELTAAREEINKLLGSQQQMQNNVPVAAPEIAPPKKDMLTSIKETLGARTLYRWRDEKGNLFITDSPPPEGVAAVKIVVHDGPKFGEGDAVIVAADPPVTSEPSRSERDRRDVTTLFSGDTEALRIAEEIQKQRESATD